MLYFNTPITYSLRALAGAYHQLALPSADSTLVTKRDPAVYMIVLDRLLDRELKSDFSEFLEKHKVRDDLMFIENFHNGFCAALGTNYFKGGDAVIHVAPGFKTADRNACHFVMKHEVAHIKNNDCFYSGAIPAITSYFAALFAVSTSSSLASGGYFIFNVSMITEIACQYFSETAADDFAVENSSVDELIGGIRFFKAFKKANKERRTTVFRKLMISPSGENRLYWTHPSLSSRIKKVEEKLKEKGFVFDESAESSNIEELGAYISSFHKKLEEIGLFKMMFGS